MLRTFFTALSVVCFSASSQLLSTNYTLFLFFCGTLLSPLLAETILKETSKVPDKWTIRLGVICSLFYLLPRATVHSNHWFWEFLGIIIGLNSATAMAYSTVYSRQLAASCNIVTITLFTSLLACVTLPILSLLMPFHSTQHSFGIHLILFGASLL